MRFYKNDTIVFRDLILLKIGFEDGVWLIKKVFAHSTGGVRFRTSSQSVYTD